MIRTHLVIAVDVNLFFVIMRKKKFTILYKKSSLSQFIVKQKKYLDSSEKCSGRDLYFLSMSTSSSFTIDLLNNFILYLYLYIVPVVYILGNLGNFLTIFILAKKTWRKNVCVFYFTVCLVSNTCYINTTLLASFFTFGLHTNLHNSNIVICKLYFYASFLFTSLLPTTLILASIDRLLISSQNVDTRLYSSKRLAHFLISLNTFFWIFYLVHTLIKVNIQELYPSYFACYYDRSSFYIQFVSYSSLTFSCLFCAIMIILCVLAFKNVRRIRAVPRQQRQQIRTMTKKDFQLLRCLFVHDIVFILFGSLITLFQVYQRVTTEQAQTSLGKAIEDFIYNVFVFLNHIPSCASFYIFIVVSKAFRNEVKRLIYKLCGKNVAVVREEDNKQENVVDVVNAIVQ